VRRSSLASALLGAEDGVWAGTSEIGRVKATRTGLLGGSDPVRVVDELLAGAVPKPGRLVPIRCGATREQVCPSCAQRNRRLRMQQCREGWHLDANSTSTSTRATSSRTTTPTRTTGLTPAPTSIRAIPVGWRGLADGSAPTRRRQDAPDLPRLPVAARTIGQKFTGGTGSAGGHPCSPP
jgi:hypothetical protein